MSFYHYYMLKYTMSKHYEISSLSFLNMKSY